jgi:aryl-alcohol dehydrogenase-like predicted oxidoreductase
MTVQVQLGLGLIGMGRPWGYRANAVPPITVVRELLDTALDVGIRFFDTAPAYGASEERLGTFLRTLEQTRLQELTIATKFGEYWNVKESSTYVDHSYDALRRSLDCSLKYLPKIDILQIHKATSQVLIDSNVRKAFEYARSAGIQSFGASVSDLETAMLAIEDDEFSLIQLPFNQTRIDLRPAFRAATARSKQLAVNRPFGEGKLVLNEAGETSAFRVDPFRFILQQPFTGVILSGTKSPVHLRENVTAFNMALLETGPP